MLKKYILNAMWGVQCKSFIYFIVGLLLGILSNVRFPLNTKLIGNYEGTGLIRTQKSLSTVGRVEIQSNTEIRDTSQVKISLTNENLPEFYEEYYKYYELNHQW
jgi:hypothetical protein